MYFSFFKLKKWGKKTAETRRRNCAVLPTINGIWCASFRYPMQPGDSHARKEDWLGMTGNRGLVHNAVRNACR